MSLREAVFGIPEAESTVSRAGGLAPIKVVGGDRSGGVFSVVVPGMRVGSLIGICIFLIMSIGFLVGGVIFMKGEPWLGFRGIWTLFSSIFALLGLSQVLKFFKERAGEKRIEGNASEISVRIYKRGLIVKDRSFPRERVEDIRSSVPANAGDSSIKRLDLIIGGEVVNLSKWMNGDDADAVVAEVRAAL